MSSLLLALALLAPAPPLEEILARLAENQERAVQARASVVYRQQTRTRLLRGGGKLAREEWREYTVTPTPDGTNKERVSFRGQYEDRGKLIPYDSPGFRRKDLDLDGEILEDLTEDLVNDRKSRDGFSADLFPLTRAEQRHYTFQFKGARQVAGRDAWIVAFEPRKEEEARPWSGEVAIDPEAFQPLSVTTKLSKNIPGWVRAVFGINLKQLGFSVTYREAAPGLWFPATYGSEFFLRLFFGYARTVTMSLENSDFRFAGADSTITFDLGGLRPARLRAEWLDDPEGLGTPRPRLSWMVTSGETDQRQTAYRILAARTREALEREQALWDSGRVASAETLHIEYRGEALASGSEMWWKVKVWDAQGRESAWSEPAHCSTGLLEERDWTAEWISHRDGTPLPAQRGALHLPAPRYFRGAARLEERPRRAALHVTALGLADPYVNGRRVTDAMFVPGWSDYKKRVYSRTFDVTALVREGVNALGAVVAEGWYSGYVGYGLLAGYGPNKLGRNFYGKTPALRMQLEVEYADGRRARFGTGPDWRVSTGPELEADLLMGETYDARRELPGWSEPEFDARGWEPAIRAAELPPLKARFFDAAGEREIDLGFTPPPVIQPYPGPPVRPVEEIKPVSVREQAPGVWIFDLGQNISGVARLKTQGPAGTRVQLRFGEMLHPDGRLMTENLRRARATDVYILKGTGGAESWTPRFTYHGFRYVEVTGLAAPATAETVTGVVVHSDTPLASGFEASDPLLAQLHKNIVWTQRSNFVEVPTDCPQRDERLGWMGDAQVYARAASFNADTAAFMTKWLDDVAEAQDPIGAFPDYAPYPMTHGPRRVSWGTAWMDAGVIVPWTQWRVYGNRRLLERHYAGISRFLDFRINRDQKLEGVDEGNDWGDWLSLGEKTPLPLIDLAYHANSLAKGAEIAAATGRNEDAQRFRDRFEVARRNFQRQYLRADCSFTVETQTAYALALAFELTGERCRQAAADALARRIEANGGRMATGFLGTYPLPHVLSANGHHELAVRLVQSRQFPSWGYEIENGATTVWERWDSYTKEKGFQNAAMNSFSHYAFGAVSEWMFRRLAGIEALDAGQSRFLIRPQPGGTLEWVRAFYDSPRGRVRTAWRRTAEGLEAEIEIPANVTAEIVLPGPDGKEVKTEAGSGTWRFLNGRRVSSGRD